MEQTRYYLLNPGGVQPGSITVSKTLFLGTLFLKSSLYLTDSKLKLKVLSQNNGGSGPHIKHLA